MAKKANRKRQEIPANETDAARFIRVVTPRVAKALKAIRQIGFCASKTYESTPKQIEQIFTVLSTEVESTCQKFTGKTEAASEFEFTK